VEGVFKTTLPKEMLVALMPSVDPPAGLNCTAKVFVAPPAFAVRVTDCAVVTADAVAVKAALVALAGTVTEEGTVSAALLLARPTLAPPVGAAAVRVTVQASVPAPVMEALLQVIALNAGAEGLEPLEGESCSAKVFVTPPELALRVTDCAVVTADAVAVKAALVALAGTVTEEGTVSAALLLARPTLNPPVGAAAVSVTVQASVPAPVIDALAQAMALSAVVVEEPPFEPLPCSFTLAVGTTAELLVMVRFPESSVADAGL
jgi:hypothetical protein